MTARRASRGRDEVLVGAGRVIARRGADGTRFADVAAETGSAISTLQYSFGNREDMIIAALRHTNAAGVQRVETALAALDDPVERMREFFRVILRADSSAEEAREWMLVWVEYWRAGARDAELAREWCAVYEQWKELLRQILRDGVAAGDFTVDNIEAGSAQLLALIDGLFVPMVLGDASTPPPVATALALSAVAAILDCPALRPAP